MLARSFWLRFLAWSTAMIAVVVAENLVFQQALGRFEWRGVELAAAQPIQLIMALAGFAAGVTLGARGARRGTAVTVALLVGASSLLLAGYLVPLGEALAGVPRSSALPGWTPLHWALPAGGAVPPHRPPSPDFQRIFAWAEQVNSRAVEALALLGFVLTATGVLVGQWSGAARERLTRDVLPWVVGLGLFGAVRVTEPISRALFLGVANRSGTSISPALFAYLHLAVPLAVLGTLLWVRCAEATRGPEGGVQP